MAARRSEERGNSSLELVWVRLNGSDTTIEGALRTVQGMRGGNPSRQLSANARQKTLPNSVTDDAPQAPNEPGLFVDPDADIAAEEVEIPGKTPAATTTTTTRKGGKPRNPKIVAGLDFNSASPTLREFAAEKKPEDQLDWYLLVAQWMKDHKQVEEIGIDEIYTASRYIGSEWSLPEDVGQPFRDGRRQGLFLKGSKNGVSVIHHIGEDRVKRMGLKE